MVTVLKNILLFFLLSLPLSVTAGALSADTVYVFRKMPADTVVAPPEKRPAKRAVKKKKQVVKRVVKAKSTKNDSVKYSEKRIYLGDRVIMRGDTGADVKKLAEIMVKSLYIDEKDVPYTKGGSVLYDGELLRAVRLFQKVSGLYGDGIVGETTIKALRKIHRWRRSAQ